MDMDGAQADGARDEAAGSMHGMRAVHAVGIVVAALGLVTPAAASRMRMK